MERIDRDELFNVVLVNGDSFEARYKNAQGGVLRFYHLRWQQGPSDDLSIATAKLNSCAMSDVSEVYITKITTTGKVLVGVSVVALVGIFVAYGGAQGQYD